MPRVNFVSAGGDVSSVDSADGVSLMRAAVTNGVRGIVGECGGNMMCATCHVYVEPEFAAVAGLASEDEAEMLEDAVCPPDERSRLSCQIMLGPEHEGLTVVFPEAQV